MTVSSRANVWPRLSAVGAVALHILIVLIAPAQEIFDTVALPLEGWLLIGAGGFVAPALLADVARRC